MLVLQNARSTLGTGCDLQGDAQSPWVNQVDWKNTRLGMDTRDQIEGSLAIKCPNISYHLAGCKKVQQVPAAEGVLERLLPSGGDSVRLRAFFAGLWPLGSEGTAAVEQLALLHPERYVLKPPREGGGNNLFGAKLREALLTPPADERRAHILMERIFHCAAIEARGNAGEQQVSVAILWAIPAAGPAMGPGGGIQLVRQGSSPAASP